MEDWEDAHEVVKADISQLKDQIGQILAALESLKTAGESSSARVEGNAHYYPPMFNAVSQSVPFPMYGLPPGYTPPIGEYAEVEQTAVSLPPTTNVILTGTQGPVSVSAPIGGTRMNETNTTDGIRVTPVPHMGTGGGFSAKVIPNTMLQGVVSSADGTKNKLEILEERLRAIEGVESYGFGDVARLSLVPGVMIPPKFKAPEFEKYKGNTCPKSHLTMYCRKMAAYAYDDKLLIHFFQDSLAGVALNWYTHLEPSRIRCWADLADAFIKQYIYNTHIAPDRLQLQSMSKRDDETFKEYAQRWRELAAQVEPPLYDREVVAMCVNTLQPPFYEHMVGNVSANFADIIIIGERIEIGVKSGKIAYTNAVFAHQARPQQQQGYYQPPLPPTDSWRAGAIAGPNQNASQNTYPRRNQFVNFTPIPTTYTELLPQLVQRGLVAICPMKPMQPPYPKGYDAEAKCSYHGGGVGHSTERCLAFKHKVQTLIDSGWLKFQEDKPSVETNPLSGHGSASTNAVEDERHELIRNAGEIRSSRKFIFKALIKVGLLKGDYDEDVTCALHPDDGHSIEECGEFEDILQDLLDRSLMQVCYEDKEGEVFTQIGGESDVTLPESLVIHFTRTTPMPVSEERSSVVIRGPSPFPYKSEKAVPWVYGAHVLYEGKGVDSAVENITGIGGMTRSGRIFASPMVTKEGTNNNETTMAAKAGEDLKGKGAQVEETPNEEEKKEISEEEACEFLKFIQQSEYKVVEQLNRMPARISLLELLMHSTSHRKLLMKVLSEAHVEH
ncbi:uncharacterized protein LOC124820924, partial [Vigna umbellata]|uniref:uncharacterized protein LOC124820924 n=1 Tax=Vigna umbellata TaxID=87088 RepID=UPI001F5E5455